MFNVYFFFLCLQYGGPGERIANESFWLNVQRKQDFQYFNSVLRWKKHDNMLEEMQQIMPQILDEVKSLKVEINSLKTRAYSDVTSVEEDQISSPPAEQTATSVQACTPAPSPCRAIGGDDSGFRFA